MYLNYFYIKFENYVNKTKNEKTNYSLWVREATTP